MRVTKGQPLGLQKNPSRGLGKKSKYSRKINQAYTTEFANQEKQKRLKYMTWNKHDNKLPKEIEQYNWSYKEHLQS